MSSGTYTYKNTYDRDNALISGFIVVFLIAAIVAFIIWGVPALQRRDARDARNAEQRLEAIHQRGFSGVTQSDLMDAGWNPGMMFEYQVGNKAGASCIMPIFVRKYEGKYLTYVPLKTAYSANIFVTYEGLKQLPQTRHCFG